METKGGKKERKMVKGKEKVGIGNRNLWLKRNTGIFLVKVFTGGKKVV